MSDQFGDVPVHTSESLARRNERPAGTLDTVKDLLGSRHRQIKALLAGQLDPVKFATVAMTTIRSNEKLQQCTPESLVMAVIMAAQRGLSLDPTLGHAYLVPYYNPRIGRLEAQYQTGYQGKIFLARRDGGVVVDSWVVHANDQFHVRRTADGDVLEHVPAGLDQEPGESIGWVARARMPDGRTLFEIMRRSDVEKIRQTVKTKYKGKDTPAWEQWFDEQGRGKVVNRLAKYLPQCPTLQLDAAQESALDGGQAQIIDVKADDGTLLMPVVVPRALEEGETGNDTPQKPPSAPTTPAAARRSDDTPAAPEATTEAPRPPSGPVTANQAIGNALRELREGAGLSQKAMADAVGVSPSTLGRWEAGQARPTATAVDAIARYHGADPADLLALAGYPNGVDTPPATPKAVHPADDDQVPPDDLFARQTEADRHAPPDEDDIGF